MIETIYVDRDRRFGDINTARIMNVRVSNLLSRASSHSALPVQKV